MARSQIVQICHWTYQRGWLAGCDGNASVLIDDGCIVTTPTAVNKGFITSDELVLVDRQGNVVRGQSKPSSELAMHLCVYRVRPDVGAVLHAHPTHCVALSVAGVSLQPSVIPEAALTIGAIATAPYATPTTNEVPQSIEPLILSHNALILSRHGSLTVGADLTDAFYALERMEHVAEIVWKAHCIRPVQPLSTEQLHALASIAARLGVGPVGSNRQT